MKPTWVNLGQDIVYMNSYGAVTAIIKPVRNQVTGEIQGGPYEAYRRYQIMGKPPDKKGA